MTAHGHWSGSPQRRPKHCTTQPWRAATAKRNVHGTAISRGRRPCSPLRERTAMTQLDDRTPAAPYPHRGRASRAGPGPGAAAEEERGPDRGGPARGRGKHPGDQGRRPVQDRRAEAVRRATKCRSAPLSRSAANSAAPRLHRLGDHPDQRVRVADRPVPAAGAGRGLRRRPGCPGLPGSSPRPRRRRRPTAGRSSPAGGASPPAALHANWVIVGIPVTTRPAR